MSGNTFGLLFRLTSFGESHGTAIGGIVEGCPAGLEVDEEFIQSELDRRRPGQSSLVTQRKESDAVSFLSGVFEGRSTGTPIGFIIPNEDAKSKDYEHLKDVYRPSHADYTYEKKYGIRDYRGGGRSSARETACRVVAGAIAKLLLKKYGISIKAYVSQVGSVKLVKPYTGLDLTSTENNPVRCPDPTTAAEMISLIEKTKKDGDTIGGIISCVIHGVPVGLGDPVFDKLHADIGKAMLSINAVKGFEYGSGFSSAAMKGSSHNDSFINGGKGVRTSSNYSGGVQGGISNGEDIYFNVGFKPVATLMQDQQTVNNKSEAVKIKGKGRHDPCVVPRAVPIVEAMAALVIADHLLRARLDKL
jgi:chorismate synthase